MTAIFALIFTSILLLTTASPPQPSPPLPSSSPDCTEELVAFSPCLGYVSVEPNNLTDMATPQCCNAFSKAVNASDGNCFCYLMRQPLIFGFPLNDSRVVSLPSVCSSVYGYGGLATIDGGSLESICSGSSALPPLRSTTGLMIPKGPDSEVPDIASSPSTSFPAENAETSPTPLSLIPEPVVSSPIALKSPLTPANHSSAVKHISNSWVFPGTLTSLVIFFFS
ncbi:protein YLS3 [Jatropha curcas]|uniref:protein YLS3 n=1 Tax=Jatropha curcas TaxID=180498 RepID=UPI0005FB91C1|nr:protein YLS3 [Jatropha curcas]